MVLWHKNQQKKILKVQPFFPGKNFTNHFVILINCIPHKGFSFQLLDQRNELFHEECETDLQIVNNCISKVVWIHLPRLYKSLYPEQLKWFLQFYHFFQLAHNKTTAENLIDCCQDCLFGPISQRRKRLYAKWTTK